ncbi:hypothetical protein FRC19_008875 [Serendipita sp. 401]|nr:hypothetical protein FRC19_008875 [Serendipita sp. 401]
MSMFVGHGRDQGPFGWSIMFSSDYIDVLSLPQKETSFFFHASPERGTTTILENYAILPQDVLRAVALLPLAWLIILVIRDALSSIGRPTNRSWRPISNVVRTLGRPFNDFLEWEDMAEYDPSNPVIIVSPSWKKRVVVAASCPLILWSGWLAISTLLDVSDKHKIQHLEWNTIYFSLITTGWLYTLLRIVFWPLNAAPVGNILFYAFQDLNYFVSFANSAVTEWHSPKGGSLFPIVQYILLLSLTSLILYVAGTLPLVAVQPSPTVSSPKATPSSDISSPEDSANFWQWATITFPSLYYPVSMVRRLEHTDVWKLSPRFLHANLFRKYLASKSSPNRAETTTNTPDGKENKRKKKREPLIVFLLKANSADILLDIALEIYKSFSGFIPAYALKQLLSILATPDDGSNNGAWGNKYVQAHYYALMTFVANLSFAQCDLAQGWCTRRCYERTRGVIFCALHYKALRRRVIGGAAPAPPKSDKVDQEEQPGNKGDGNAKDMQAELEQERSADLGKVVNLMHILGTSAFAGVAVILSAYLINWPLMKWNLHITRYSWKARDKRMTGVNELFQSIRFLKLMGWEGGWAERVLQSRELELAWRVQENICSAILVFIWTWIPSATALASFIAYTLISGKPLTVSVAFTALGVFGHLQSSMGALPGHLFALFHAYISMQRINGFLTEDEVPDWASSLKREAGPSSEHSTSPIRSEVIGYENATLEWYRMKDKNEGPDVDTAAVQEDRNAAEARQEERHVRLDDGQPIHIPDNELEQTALLQEETVAIANLESAERSVSRSRGNRSFKLQDLNVSLPIGKLTLVTGITGAGKTAFLVGLLGEMSLLKGKVHLDKSNHKVAYCAQLSWLEHATIRDNIVYGSPLGYDEARYDAVVAACALERDLEILPAGDMTEIGEKGVSLSGGQRARVALARALYSPAKTILLDDPLAAVDMHTARHLVQHCFGGPLMANRTVVLVTHHVKLCLPSADYLVEIHGGRIEKQGSIAELKRRGQLTEVLSHDVVETEPESSDKSHSLENEADLVLGSHETPDGSTKVGASTPSDEGETENQNPKKPKWRLSTAEAGKLVDEEARAEGRVSWRTYKTYIQAAGYWSWGAAFLLMIQIRGINILNQFYLSKWGEAYNHPKNVSYLIANWLGDMKTLGGDVTVSKIPIFEDLPPPDQNVRPWLLIYFLISLLGAFTVLGYISLGYYASLQASRSLFKRMLARLSRAPTRFFDVTPIGRILNRFVADIGTVDGTVNNSARSALSGALNFVSSFIVIVYVVPTFAPFALFIAWLYVRLAPHYIRTSRDLRRLESISLSPAFAGFDELLHGLVHVRAFGAEQRYQDRFHHRVDTFQAFDHSYWLVAFWLRWRYDCLGSVVVYLTTLFALSAKVSTGFAAVVILNSEVFAEASRQVVRVLAQVELDFNSVERIGEYLDVVQEAPAIIEKSRPPAYWPSSTNGISVEDLWVRYSETSPDVLLGLSFEIRPGEKVGVVGRTGSGKTTLCAAFLRVVEARQGRIMVDGIDISKIGLEDLRTRITVVSQDVALFEGSVRSNLDPFEEHSDEECWDVLRRCHLATNLSTSETNGAQAKGTLKKRKAVFTTLEEQISVAGGSLSAGQRQLVALARAMLRRSQVVLTDEATSAIDLELDDQIQQTIRQELGDATVITIAHRLRTVIEYDRILVLDRGRIVEFDTPARLLRNPEGVFAKLCRGSADWEDLKRLVRE